MWMCEISEANCLMAYSTVGLFIATVFLAVFTWLLRGVAKAQLKVMGEQKDMMEALEQKRFNAEYEPDRYDLLRKLIKRYTTQESIDFQGHYIRKAKRVYGEDTVLFLKEYDFAGRGEEDFQNFLNHFADKGMHVDNLRGSFAASNVLHRSLTDG